jgi:hypothetical protein
MEEPNGHRAEHVTSGVPSPADHDDRVAPPSAAWALALERIASAGQTMNHNSRSGHIQLMLEDI